ncbi:MAG: precorrin-8X methylmutase [Stellaceae bacterium]
MFDTFLIVDWSAANVPRLGRDSIWACRRDAAGETLANPPTRRAAQALNADWLAAAQDRTERVLLGFDFPFGYPAGFAARLGLSGTPWRAVWDEIARLLDDDENNRNNRFDVAAAFNYRISGGGFPFWGCPAAPLRAHLQGKHHRRHGSDGLAERRLVDVYIPSAQPCWKLLGAGSVGGQALTGIPVVRALRDDPRWRRHTEVWPFETGLRASEAAGVVMAEIYPSLWAVKPGADETKDAAQVRAVARFLDERDRAGELPALFAGDPGLTVAERDRVEREEAWTLGVTAARQHPIAVPASAVDARSPVPHASPSAPSRRAAGSAEARLALRRRKEGRLPGSVSPGLTRPSTASSARDKDVDAQIKSAQDGSDSLCEGRDQRFGADAGLSDNLPAAWVPSSPRSRGEGRGEGQSRVYNYLRDPKAISRRSLALVRAEADLARFPRPLRGVAARIAHAAGDIAILGDLAWSARAATAGRAALAAGAPILVDSTMAAAGIIRERLSGGSEIRCLLGDPAVAGLAMAQRTTRSAAAVELWRPYLAGAVVAIGNAPTALFRLLEILAEGAAAPALILGFPVGFVGAAEAKAALAGFGRGLEFITLHGRRGGSAVAAAAANALAGR